MKRGVVWTDPLIKALRSYRRAGLSAAQIADRLAREHKVDLSRSAVLGKLNRLGLMGAKSEREPSAAALASPRRRAPGLDGGLTCKINWKIERRRQNKRNQPSDDGIVHRLATRAATEPAPEPAAPAARKSLLALRDGDCRYPYGEVGASDFGFCGAPALSGCVYCAGHARIVFRTMADSP